MTKRYEPLIVVTLAAAGAFAALTRRVFAGATRALDRRSARVGRRVPRAGRNVLRALGAASSPRVLVPATLCAAAWIARRRGARAAAPVAAVPFVAMAVGATSTLLLPPRRAPDAPWLGRAEPCYPSGHATGATAEALVAGYVCAREGLGIGAPLAALAAATALSAARVLRGRHWLTDVLAGHASGTAVAGLVALGYEALRAHPGGARG